MRAEEIENLPPGSRVRINGVEWVRMADSYDGFDSCILNPEDGDWMRWYALCLANDEVELTHKGEIK
jgi:hypothetical protein